MTLMIINLAQQAHGGNPKGCQAAKHASAARLGDTGASTQEVKLAPQKADGENPFSKEGWQHHDCVDTYIHTHFHGRSARYSLLVKACVIRRKYV